MASTTESVAALVAAFFPGAVRTSALELAAGQLDIDAGHVRVALTRLRQKGTIEVEARGLYRLSPAVALRQTALGPWTERLQMLRPWGGSFVLALTGSLPKSDRPARRRREHALARLGFREKEYGFWLRPHCLRLEKEEVHERLVQLGFPDEGHVMVGRELSFDPRSLWPVERYQRMADTLDRQKDQLALSPGAGAAVEGFRTANEHIRRAIQDPLLPDVWVGADGRRAYWRALVEYDAFARELWRTRVWEAAGIPIEDARDETLDEQMEGGALSASLGETT